MVDETKLTSKKRKGVAHFIKYFPVYVGRVEQQLVGADVLEIRGHVDSAYEKIVHSMFECLKHMATLDGDGEDKGQLNYHVLIVGECHVQKYVDENDGSAQKTCTTLSLRSHTWPLVPLSDFSSKPRSSTTRTWLRMSRSYSGDHSPN